MAIAADAHVFVPHGDDDMLKLPECSNVILSAASQQWFEKHKKRDSRYCEFFIRRVEQLSAGERSRILQKVRAVAPSFAHQALHSTFVVPSKRLTI